MAKSKKVRMIEAWQREHPEDDVQTAWRKARGLDKETRLKWLRSRIAWNDDPWIVSEIEKLKNQ
jgi:hypothetical protein